MNKSRQLSAITLTATMLFTTLFTAGCNRKKSDTQTLSEDTPWYTAEEINLSDSYEAEYDDLEYIYFNYLGVADGLYLMQVEGNRTVPDDFDWETEDYEQFYFSEFAAFDSSGNKVHSISIKDLVNNDYSYNNGYSMAGDKVIVSFVEYDPNTWNETYYNIEVDPMTGETGERIPVEHQAVIQNDNESNEGSVRVGNYSVTKLYKYGGTNNSYRLLINDNEGNTSSLDMETLFPGLNIWNIDSILDIGDDKAIIMASGDNSPVFTLDLSSMTMEQLDSSETEWLKDINTYNIVNCNGAAYSVDQGGVKMLDFDNNRVTEVFDFNNCNVSHYDTQNYSLLDYSENELIFMCNRFNYYQYIDNIEEYCIVKLTKADTNPNAGKTVLTIGCIGGISQPVANAVCQYNNENDEYFITILNNYGKYNINYQSDWTNEELNNAYMNAQADMSSQLAIDLMNGDGPDIIIGGFMYGQLNNDNYLLDVTSYLQNIDTDKYFNNVFSDAKTGDKLFQIPLGFTISGIITDRSNVDDGQTGFTYDQYLAFVDEVCNGKDPITDGRTIYFTECLNAMNDLIYSGDSVDYSNEAFTSLAQYCRDHVNEQADYGDSEIIIDDVWQPDPAMFSSFTGFSGYLNNVNSMNGPQSQVILGLPSIDGRGPSIQIGDSAAISATSDNPDACWEFIEILLGNEVQEQLAKSWYFPVNIEAFEQTAQLQIDGYNSQAREYSQWEYIGYGMPTVEIDSSIITMFEEECIASAHLLSSDPSITLIISEEIPAYFSGQKDINQVIEILNNRVTTVLNERK